MVNIKNKYPWRFVGPWYRKNSVGGGKGYSGRPIIQKYASSDFINDFIKDPQHSLQFVCEDFIDRPCEDIFTLVSDQNQDSDTLKLFLDGHNRFYLVICELHCHAPGFPKVDRERVCEAGFVIRKKVPVYEQKIHSKINQLYAEKGLCIQKIQQNMNNVMELKSKVKNEGVISTVLNARVNNIEDKISTYKEKLTEVERNLKAIIYSEKLSLATLGWTKTEHKGVGKWDAVSKTPVEIEEEILPLYPLIAEQDDKNHTGGHQSIWFGLIPTQSADVDELGNPKFDDDTMYDLRCFVRKHKNECTKQSTRNDCHGELVWSVESEPYNIASPYDLDGTGHKPINIKLPDTNALKVQSQRRPVGSGSNVRMIMPANSNLAFSSDGLDMDAISQKNNNSQQICFFAIPLITIIALFVLNLFLPIVVFILQLWFLLSLKLCIPPSVSFSADLAADIKASGFEINATLEARIEVEIRAGFNLGNDMLDGTAAHNGFISELNGNPNDTARLVVDIATDFSADPEDSPLGADVPVPTNGLKFFDEVTA